MTNMQVPPHTSSRTWGERTRGGRRPGRRGHRIASGIAGGTARRQKIATELVTYKHLERTRLTTARHDQVQRRKFQRRRM